MTPGEGAIQIKESVVLDKLHIYSSSSYRMRKPNLLHEGKHYKYTDVSGNGGVNKSTAIESTIYIAGTHYFIKKLTYIKYELI
ncbi:MAG: hypothetical protein H7321_04700, partial [Bacteroidia bacterium]|nr:hypothetical protein [Bacteroidia bacterium]